MDIENLDVNPHERNPHDASLVYQQPRDAAGRAPRRRQPSKPKTQIFPCEWTNCGHSFQRRSDLTRHVRIHTNERPWKCEHCDKTFIQRSALTIHQRCHTGERPHPCDQCDKAFADTSSLARHRRIHTGARPYICPECSHSFCRKTTLRKHLESKHQILDAELPTLVHPRWDPSQAIADAPSSSRKKARAPARRGQSSRNQELAEGDAPAPHVPPPPQAEDVGRDDSIPAYIDPAIALATAAHHAFGGASSSTANGYQHEDFHHGHAQPFPDPDDGEGYDEGGEGGVADGDVQDHQYFEELVREAARNAAVRDPHEHVLSSDPAWQ